MIKNAETLTGISPKCLQQRGKAFIGATGELWPCCWLYSQRKDLHKWTDLNGLSMDAIDLKNHTVSEVKASTLWIEFHKSFDTPTCKRECGKDSWDNKMNTKRGDITLTKNN